MVGPSGRYVPRPADGVEFDEGRLLLVSDELQPCPYLPGQVARMPLQWPGARYPGKAVDAFLAAGYRRSGGFLYRTQCPACQACQPTRLSVADFQMRTSQRRVLNRGDAALSVSIGMPILDTQRLTLFNDHRNQRGLSESGDQTDANGYHAFLIDSFCQTQEFRFHFEEELVGIAIVDVGESAVSAVYTYFNPAFSRFSIGTYSILKQIEWCQETGKEFLYLGLYVAENQHLNYKARFAPQQRRVDGSWNDVL
ncbi:arginyl-tRNA-protein transferase [Roseimaritima multifibrata]|uniref:Arginyl-tRNA-protein transferase n=1 Tax=Roseimaritima multifibrata TaxID=1930274 RepID=A0A517MK77_9BACT|nr:arginyltransferase [Roseimaritima multifibrata]QDS95278.1 arginyl-tRNA-protein transferase [Roseimaritima multifibrata]